MVVLAHIKSPKLAQFHSGCVCLLAGRNLLPQWGNKGEDFFKEPSSKMIANMSNLSRDLVEEILSRVPATSLRRVRSTCKTWNSLSKDVTFIKKHLAQAAAAAIEGEILAVVLVNRKLYLMSVGILNGSDPSIRPRGNLISLSDSDKLDITQVYYCEGLLLCVTEDYTRLVLWNPYTGENRWISVEPKSVDHSKFWYCHALGYEEGESRRTHKILRFAHPPSEKSVYEIYDANSNSWRVLDVTADWGFDVDAECNNSGLSLKGNIYWFAQDVPAFLLCFDFTTERFVPLLRLPFDSYFEDRVTLSSVREEQLAVLFQNLETCEMEVWITTKIEPNAVSWSKFLAVDMSPLTWFRFFSGGSFLIDEEKRAVVVFDGEKNASETNRYTAYFIGENDYFREVDLGKIEPDCKEVFPYAFSYVPSSVHINQPA